MAKRTKFFSQFSPLRGRSKAARAAVEWSRLPLQVRILCMELSHGFAGVQWKELFFLLILPEHPRRLDLVNGNGEDTKKGNVDVHVQREVQCLCFPAIYT